jgi:hypothetical protein
MFPCVIQGLRGGNPSGASHGLDTYQVNQECPGRPKPYIMVRSPFVRIKELVHPYTETPL